MCEMMALKFENPTPIEQVLQYARQLDEYGVAGFSWGLVWRTQSGTLKRYRAVEGIRRDPLVQQALSGVTSSEYLVHLRRPSLMTTISFLNAQPYLGMNEQVAFAHNGYFMRHHEYRSHYQSQILGTSDSEVGFAYYLDLLSHGEDPTESLVKTHADLEGDANIGVIRSDGSLLFYAGHHDNRVYRFTMDGAKIVSTTLHSADDYVFQSIFARAEQIELVPPRTVCPL